MKRAIFVLAVLLSGSLANCDLNPQPFPPRPVASSGDRNAGAGAVFGGSSGASTGTGSAGADAAASLPALTDAGPQFSLDATANADAGTADAGREDTVRGSGEAGAPSGEAGGAEGETGALSDALSPADAPNEPKGFGDAPGEENDGDAAWGVAADAGD